jgi:hypothetical protein
VLRGTDTRLLRPEFRAAANGDSGPPVRLVLIYGESAAGKSRAAAEAAVAEVGEWNLVVPRDGRPQRSEHVGTRLTDRQRHRSYACKPRRRLALEDRQASDVVEHATAVLVLQHAKAVLVPPTA